MTLDEQTLQQNVINIANDPHEEAKMRHTAYPSQEEQVIKASGQYNIDEALYDHEEYPSDFDSDSADEAQEDAGELTAIIQNYKTLLNDDMEITGHTFKSDTTNGVR